MMGYLVARSFKQETPSDTENILSEAEKKAALALLGFTIAKFIFSFLFSKVVIALPKFAYLYMTGAACAITLFVHTLVSSLFHSKYTLGWFFTAFFWGIQNVAIAGKIENGVLNPVTEEVEESLDFSIICRIIGVILIGFVGAGVRDSNPIIIMIPLIVIFLLSFTMSFLNIKEEGDKVGNKLPLEEGDASLDKLGKRLIYE